jgi:hypothetical protein
VVELVQMETLAQAVLVLSKMVKVDILTMFHL